MLVGRWSAFAVAQWATRDALYLGVVEAARRAAARDTVSARSTPGRPRVRD
jgi:hypothetical protein